MIPAMRAVANTSPFFAWPDRQSARVSGAMTTRAARERVPGGAGLGGDVDHAGLARSIEMGEDRLLGRHAGWAATRR